MPLDRRLIERLTGLFRDEVGRSGDSPAGPSSGGEPSLDERYLTNEELVFLLLDDRSGRMWQSQLVEATGWSKSKVSRVLQAMETDGSVHRLQLGRQNLVCLPDLDLDSISTSVDEPSNDLAE